MHTMFLIQYFLKLHAVCIHPTTEKYWIVILLDELYEQFAWYKWSDNEPQYTLQQLGYIQLSVMKSERCTILVECIKAQKCTETWFKGRMRALALTRTALLFE